MKIKHLVLEKLTNELNRDSRFKIDAQACANDTRLDIIIALIDQMRWPLDKTVDIITAVFLLHISNDLHQNVSVGNQAENGWQILHGDRLSSQAYILFVKYNSLKLIESMSQALKEVNQLNIELKQFIHSADFEFRLYIKKKRVVDLKLIRHLIDYLELRDFAKDLLEENLSNLSKADFFKEISINAK